MRYTCISFPQWKSTLSQCAKCIIVNPKVSHTKIVIFRQILFDHVISISAMNDIGRHDHRIHGALVQTLVHGNWTAVTPHHNLDDPLTVRAGKIVCYPYTYEDK